MLTATARPARTSPWILVLTSVAALMVMLDAMVVTDLDASTAEIEQLGGTWLEAGHTRELEGFRWRCMADPEGNEFDIDVLPGA